MIDRLHNLKDDCGVVFRSIRPNDKDVIGVPEFSDGVRHGTTSEAGDQTGHCRDMSEPDIVINAEKLCVDTGSSLNS